MGADHLAFRIRQIAGRHGIPIVERKPLARAIKQKSRSHKRTRRRKARQLGCAGEVDPHYGRAGKQQTTDRTDGQRFWQTDATVKANRGSHARRCR